MRLLTAFIFLSVALCAMQGLKQPLQAAEVNRTTTLMDEEWPTPEAPPPATEQPQFAKVIDDLPLMPGLQLDQDDDVLFATSDSGRIAETEAVGSVDVDDVYRFYRKTLVQMGWKILDARSFRREGDILRIDAKADDKKTRVLFSITPANQ